ncbi:hypothetical protein Tco_0680880 [Tanacetum coccineum]|uniref:Uncharacterized protein n=1 Tax=Tanacetum coccineum TaxID=301880 RepID=A0ABQ4XN71_9ASTR
MNTAMATFWLRKQMWLGSQTGKGSMQRSYSKYHLQRDLSKGSMSMVTTIKGSNINGSISKVQYIKGWEDLCVCVLVVGRGGYVVVWWGLRYFGDVGTCVGWGCWGVRVLLEWVEGWLGGIVGERGRRVEDPAEGKAEMRRRTGELEDTKG